MDNANYLSGFKYLTKTKRHAEMKLTPLEGELQTVFVACERSDLTTTTAITSAMAAKW
jgi:hypothetical protein